MKNNTSKQIPPHPNQTQVMQTQIMGGGGGLKEDAQRSSQR